MAEVGVVLDDLLSLPVTPGAVGVQEGRQCAPSDALGSEHFPNILIGLDSQTLNPY
jgi:hypothetical protein